MVTNNMDLIRGDKSEWLGRFRIDEYIIEKDKYIKGNWQKNLITNKWKEQMALVTTGIYEPYKITMYYLGLGNDDTAVVATNTEMNNIVGELKEPIVSSIHNNTTPNIAQGSWYYESTEAQYYDTLKEIALFSLDGLLMLTHALISPTVTFNNTKTLNVLYEVEY